MSKSNKQLHVIYIPGLGDAKIAGQRKAVASWKLHGVSGELFQMNWIDKEPWEPKFERLLARIDAAEAAGKSVGIVGASAGASAVINAFAARKDKVVGAVLIAGKVNRPHAISKSLIRKNPAFGTSAEQAQDALKRLSPADRRRILSRFGVIDAWVPAIDSRIPGAKNRVVPTVGHFTTIATQLVLGARSFLKFLKQLDQIAA